MIHKSWSKLFYRQKGFTLIELLVVIAIISALAVAVFVALNPAQRLKDARDSKRRHDVETYLTAIHEYIVDNKAFPPTFATTVQTGGVGNNTDFQIGFPSGGCTTAVNTGGCATSAVKCIDLQTDLAKYIKSIPIDPLGGATWTTAKTGYAVNVDANNLITVKACATGTGTTEGALNISVSR